MRNTSSAMDLPAPAPDVIGKAFVQQYYNILFASPELVHKFYKNNSQIGRPGKDGNMTTTTTLQGINEKIVSLKYEGLETVIKSVNCQTSFNSGLVVLVTGQMTGKDSKTRSFSQNFYLAPQHSGYYVLNDIFCYTENEERQDVAGLLLDLYPEVEKKDQAESNTRAEDLSNKASGGEEDVLVAEVVEEPESALPELEFDFTEYVVVDSI